MCEQHNNVSRKYLYFLLVYILQYVLADRTLYIILRICTVLQIC